MTRKILFTLISIIGVVGIAKADPSNATLDAQYSEDHVLTLDLEFNSKITRRKGCDVTFRIAVYGEDQASAVYESRAQKITLRRGVKRAVFEATDVDSADLIDGDEPIASFQAFVFCSGKTFFFTDRDASFIRCDGDPVSARDFAVSVRRKLKLKRTS